MHMIKADLERMIEYIDRIAKALDRTLTVLSSEERQDLSKLLSIRLAENERRN